MDGTKSESIEVTSSVPQGTVLAPVLFLIMISDINKNVRDSKVSSFADDTKIGRRINNADDIKVLQRDIDAIFKWANENNIQFNGEKFVALKYRLSNDNTIADYVTDSGEQICSASQVRDLGILMTTDLTFSNHYNLKLAIARKLMGIIWRSFSTRKAIVMTKLWKSLILPVIEYCSILVSPHLIQDIQKIEAIQRTFTSNLEEVKHLNYWERLKNLNMYSLERRRERYLLIYVWKILEGKVPNCSVNPIDVYWSDRQGRLCRNAKLKGKGKTKTLREQTLAVTGPNLFNCLPAHIRNMQGVELETFKKALDHFLREVPDCPSLPGYRDPFGQGSNSIEKRRLKRVFPAGQSSRPGFMTRLPEGV